MTIAEAPRYWHEPGEGLHLSMRNRLPVGPGSRGGRWHEPGYRAIYQAAWRAAHPDYREREMLRKVRRRALAQGRDPETAIAEYRTRRPLPLAARACVCSCGCEAEVVMTCGFCQSGLCEVPA